MKLETLMALDVEVKADVKAMMQEVADLAVTQVLAKLNIGSAQAVNNEKPIAGKELCEYLGITAPTLIRYRNKGKIPFIRIGTKIMFNKAEVIIALNGKKR